jgi:amidase
MTGIVPISRTFDSIGFMAKCSEDIANLLDAIVDSSQPGVPSTGYKSSILGSWSELRIGVVDPEKWFLKERSCRPNANAFAQIVSHYRLFTLTATSDISIRRSETRKRHMRRSRGLFRGLN